MSTNIEWTDETWNPVRGCSRVSEGCRHCYAERVAARFAGKGQPYEGLVTVRSAVSGLRYDGPEGSGSWTDPRWNGEVRLVPERLADPLRWRKPRRVFVNSMSDLFHEKLSNEDIAAVFGVMAAAPRHTFQILTKRPERMREWFAWADGQGRRSPCLREAYQWLNGGIVIADRLAVVDGPWPLPNVWLGVSVEDQATADQRIPLLLETPAAVRFVSYEPALGPVDFTRLSLVAEKPPHGPGVWLDALRGHVIGPDDMLDTQLDWVIAGSESGPGARPAELDWFRRVRDDCAAARVAFFFKQWVGPAALEGGDGRVGIASPLTVRTSKVSLPILDGRQHAEFPR